ncbi:hypothetical protein SAMN06297129_0755 [Pseudooceanicola antarcticus]|uniref:Uncharacterized protein n=1 Tax=Pseudooceanicola antarcticus TaxID=1247613 RepID=A0A285HY22_9RHOB|nr:hypothetical protein [Pseudooceanicola antarcticus]PJE30378.1 hypothetical protein CVM39_06635 [Pseudooceanicola antarcticus]SNY40642.1 hypothetical protein SAMN06297129_0755 [Pseudooceanicola antarcticus]
MNETNVSDRVGLTESHVSRRYFRKFEAIMGHLAHVAGVMRAEKHLDDRETEVLARHVAMLTFTFRALSMKYLLAGRDTGRFFGSLTIDNHESGFPTAQELMVMANDAGQAGRHLASMPSADGLKRQMLDEIISERQVPTRTQFAMSQRLYYEELSRGDLFWPRNDPEAIWLKNSPDGKRRSYLLHWSVYDTQANIPVLYLMEVEDTGRHGLPGDANRWPQVQAHLMAQSLGGLKLLTIAKGFDQDFESLHPKRLRRIHLGPMYSHGYTQQSGPIRDVLAQAAGEETEDWALAWTSEELVSKEVQTEKTGWFGAVEREVFELAPYEGAELGATTRERALILPARPFQVLSEMNPPGFARVKKYVVGAGDRVLSY